MSLTLAGLFLMVSVPWLLMLHFSHVADATGRKVWDVSGGSEIASPIATISLCTGFVIIGWFFRDFRRRPVLTILAVVLSLAVFLLAYLYSAFVAYFAMGGIL